MRRLCLRAVGEPLGSSPAKIRKRTSVREILLFWSKRRDSNPRSPVPEASQSSLLTTFVYFLVLFSPKAMLSDALVRTVSTQSESVYGQRCGHHPISTR